MDKGYYIHFQGRQSVGVSKKIDMQLEEFNKFYDITELDIKSTSRGVIKRIIGLFPTASISRDYLEAFNKIKNPKFIYVRRTVCDREYLYFWKKIKEKFPNCKIIIEIFTYPYDRDDFAKWNAWPFWIKEILYRNRLKKYVDRFVTYTKDQKIFGIPCICNTNGINVDRIRPLSGEYIDGEIRLIGVAYMQRQHGYERVIKGMGEYYNKHEEHPYKITLKLVGNGPEKVKYKKLVNKYGLGDYVIFYDTTVGDELDNLYDESDIALAAFGMYKVSYFEPIGAIKTRECLAKGVPLVSGSPIDVLEDDYPYARIFANDSSPINMYDIVDFWKNIRARGKNRAEISVEMRNYAREKAGMNVIMKPVIDFIEG